MGELTPIGTGSATTVSGTTRKRFKSFLSSKGETYYVNEETNETTWNLPEGALVTKNDHYVSPGRKRFSSHVSSSTGKRFFKDEETGETTWRLPDGATVTNESLGAAPRGKRFSSQVSSSGKVYYVDDETRETTWNLPKGAIITNKGTKTSKKKHARNKSFQRLETQE